MTMSNPPFLQAESLTTVQADSDAGWAQILFLKGSNEMALRFDIRDVERLCKGLAGIIIGLAQRHGISYAAKVTDLNVAPNIDGVSLTFVVDGLTTESIHLSQDQTKELRDRLDGMLAAQARMPVQ